MTVVKCGQHWSPLPAEAILKFHTDAYVKFLQLIEHNGHDVVDEAANFALNTSVCFSETAWCVCTAR